MPRQRRSRLGPNEYRISDGKILKGYRVYGNNTIAPPPMVVQMLEFVGTNMADDMNINLHNYRYDFTCGRLIPKDQP